MVNKVRKNSRHTYGRVAESIRAWQAWNSSHFLNWHPRKIASLKAKLTLAEYRLCLNWVNAFTEYRVSSEVQSKLVGYVQTISYSVYLIKLVVLDNGTHAVIDFKVIGQCVFTFQHSIKPVLLHMLISVLL
jgi:hypothetical protein